MTSRAIFVQFDHLGWWPRIWQTTGSGVFRFLGTLLNRIPGHSALRHLGLLSVDVGALWVRFPRKSPTGRCRVQLRSAGALEQAVTVREIAEALRCKRSQAHPEPIQSRYRIGRMQP